jgi:processive 1,2-diacylglycerol beta-glucosyltransferase
VKKVLILTVSYGEGHNSAARGVQQGLARVSPTTEVEVHDLFAETYRGLNNFVRQSYLALIDRWPRSWGYVYRWLDQKQDYDKDFARFTKLKRQFRELLTRLDPDVVVSTFPPYPYLLQQVLGPNRRCKNIVVITDSITVNSIWYQSAADYFLAPNPQSAAVVHAGGIALEQIRTFGFPVNPRFADLVANRPPPSAKSRPRLLYMINAGTRRAPELVRRLLEMNVELTVTVGRDDKLRRAIEAASAARDFKILGWTNELPRLLCETHLLIGKAGGATVQETIAAGCPIIINHIVSGQEEGNARLIVETNSGAIALSNDEVIEKFQRAFTNNAELWREWENNITKLSRPRAALDIAEFILGL